MKTVFVLCASLALVCAATVSAQTPSSFTHSAPQRSERLAPGFEALKAQAAVPREKRYSARVLDLSSAAPIRVRKSGYYVLDRDWIINNQGQPGDFLVVDADNVTLDFRGYTVEVANEGAAIRILGHNFTMRNGSLSGVDDQGQIIGSHATGTVIESMRLGGQNAGTLELGAALRDSELSFISGFSGAVPASHIERNVFRCGLGCIRIAGASRVLDNYFEAASSTVLGVEGDGNLLERNVFGPTQFPAVEVSGNNNLVRDNTILVTNETTVAVAVSGGANVLEGNIAMPAVADQRAVTGLRFLGDGNFYGNNRLAALVSVDLGSTAQTDWGGNVAF